MSSQNVTTEIVTAVISTGHAHEEHALGNDPESHYSSKRQFGESDFNNTKLGPSLDYDPATGKQGLAHIIQDTLYAPNSRGFRVDDEFLIHNPETNVFIRITPGSEDAGTVFRPDRKNYLERQAPNGMSVDQFRTGPQELQDALGKFLRDPNIKFGKAISELSSDPSRAREVSSITQNLNARKVDLDVQKQQWTQETGECLNKSQAVFSTCAPEDITREGNTAAAVSDDGTMAEVDENKVTVTEPDDKSISAELNTKQADSLWQTIGKRLGIVGGIVIGGSYALEGDYVSAAESTIPLGSTGVAAYEGRGAEATLATIEEIPVVGLVITEIARPIASSLDYDVEEGIIQSLVSDDDTEHEEDQGFEPTKDDLAEAEIMAEGFNNKLKTVDQTNAELEVDHTITEFSPS